MLSTAVKKDCQFYVIRNHNNDISNSETIEMTAHLSGFGGRCRYSPTEVLYVGSGGEADMADGVRIPLPVGVRVPSRPSADNGRGVGGRSRAALSALKDRPESGDPDGLIAFDSRLRMALPMDRRFVRPGEDTPVNQSAANTNLPFHRLFRD